MHMYGCELWNVTDSDVDKFSVAGRKVKRRIWKLPNTAHNRIIHNIASNIFNSIHMFIADIKVHI